MKLKEKIYYHLSESIFLQRTTTASNNPGPQKKLFLYFDYEREFSGYKTTITNQDVFQLIDSLERRYLKGTWFTVGKVVEKYFPTVEYLLEKGHELGSHTFSHISPYEISDEDLLKDLEYYEETKKKYKLNIHGFHSPKDRWNLSMFGYLKQHGYCYDIFPPKQKKNFLGKKFQKFSMHKIQRLTTLGDDWVLYDQKKSRAEIFEYFKSLYQQISPGEIRGIGAHPWVLYSDENILLGYEDFLDFLTHQNDVEVKTALSFVRELEQSDIFLPADKFRSR